MADVIQDGVGRDEHPQPQRRRALFRPGGFIGMQQFALLDGLHQFLFQGGHDGRHFRQGFMDRARADPDAQPVVEKFLDARPRHPVALRQRHYQARQPRANQPETANLDIVLRDTERFRTGHMATSAGDLFKQVLGDPNRPAVSFPDPIHFVIPRVSLSGLPRRTRPASRARLRPVHFNRVHPCRCGPPMPRSARHLARPFPGHRLGLRSRCSLGFDLGIACGLRWVILGNGFFRVFVPFHLGIRRTGFIPRCFPARRQRTVPAGLVQPFPGLFQVQQQLG